MKKRNFKHRSQRRNRIIDAVNGVHRLGPNSFLAYVQPGTRRTRKEGKGSTAYQAAIRALSA